MTSYVPPISHVMLIRFAPMLHQALALRRLEHDGLIDESDGTYQLTERRRTTLES